MTPVSGAAAFPVLCLLESLSKLTYLTWSQDHFDLSGGMIYLLQSCGNNPSRIRINMKNAESTKNT